MTDTISQQDNIYLELVSNVEINLKECKKKTDKARERCQRARLQLRRSKFESRWGLQFFCKNVFEKNKNEQK